MARPGWWCGALALAAYLAGGGGIAWSAAPSTAPGAGAPQADSMLGPPRWSGQPIDVAVGLHIRKISRWAVPFGFVASNLALAVHFLT